MSIAHWAADHRRSILFLLAVLALGGAASALKLPVSLFPHVDYPRIVVSLDAGDRPAEQMVVAVTRPVEQAIRSVPGLRSIRSKTSRGSADLSINLDWGANMVEALLEVEFAVSRMLPALPPGTSFTAKRMDPTVFPVAAYSLTSDTLSLTRLRSIAQYQILPLFSSIDGVAHVEVVGGALPEYQVDVDQARLNAYGLSLNDVINALSASNVLQAVGRLEDQYKLFLVLSDTTMHNPAEIGRTVLKSGADGVVRLDDIAHIAVGTKPQWLRVTANGHDAVSIDVYQQPGGNTVKIVQDVQAKLADFKDKLPATLKIANWYDQSQLITASASSVRDAILIGIGLAAVVLLVFLRSIKITLVAVVVVPAVLAATALILFTLHKSFNIMTLGGMAAAIGLIVDDAVVMIEHIVRRMRGAEGTRHERVRLAAREFTQPLVGSSASTVIIFLPLAFLGGVTGAFFRALSLTMASALAISFLVAWLAVPLLADHLLTDRDAEKEDAGAFVGRLQQGYRRLLTAVFDRPWLVALVLVPLLGTGYYAYRQVGTGFMPQIDEGGFILDYRSQAGTSLTETDRLLRQVGTILQATPEVATYSRRTGTQLGGGLTEANEGDFFIRLKPLPRRPIEAVMEDVRRHVEHDVPGLDIEMAQLMQDLIGDLTAVPQPIEIKLYSDDLKTLMATAPKVAAAISKIAGVVDVNDGIVLAGDALDIKVDRAKAALEGVDPEAVTQQIGAMLAGVVTTHVQHGVTGGRDPGAASAGRSPAHRRSRAAETAGAGWASIPGQPGCHPDAGNRTAADHSGQPQAVGRRHRAHKRSGPGVDHSRRQGGAGAERPCSQRHVLRAGRALQAAADRLHGPHGRLRGGCCPCILASSVSV